ncbi:MAG TPA: CocE/NonD family hydrolase [Caulobacter sp.]|nr:CocE/NonD family hydrolase [Caulobacter sp.]
MKRAALSVLLVLLLALLTPERSPAAGPAPDFEVREVMVPMRDGVRLYTLVVVPNAARDAPILLTRTPFFAQARRFAPKATRVGDFLPPSERAFVEDGYIRVFQDVRGRGRSEGEYVVTRPPRGPLNRSTTDHATDAADTIDWLLDHLPQANGRVGVLGSSYEGFTAAAALTDPHPALKAVVPLNPMMDGWMGDDWFHHGAFRPVTLDFIAFIQGNEAADGVLHPETSDDYAAFLHAGSAAGMARASGVDTHPFWKDISRHPAYDAYWRGLALDRELARRRPAVPTLWVAALWDQEDSWGAVRGYMALEPADRDNDRNFLVLGPWRHGGMLANGSTLGPLDFDSDTAADFRRRILKPFLDQHLKTGGRRADIPPVLAFRTGANRWEALERWSEAPDRRFYLGPDGTLSDRPPVAPGADHFISDPADPAPYAARPIHGNDPDRWRTWLVADQRYMQSRRDQLSYLSPPMTRPLLVTGAPQVDLYAATTGTDADWVVKLIDVYPDSPDIPAALRGHHLIISADIFRGRYRQGFDRGRPLAPGQPLRYRFALTPVSHVLKPGHRLMVQVQSSWFPLYDRNPQTFVPNIFFADADAYRPATHTLFRSRSRPSSVSFRTTSDVATAQGSLGESGRFRRAG